MEGGLLGRVLFNHACPVRLGKIRAENGVLGKVGIMGGMAELIGIYCVPTLAKGRFEKRHRQNNQQCCVAGADRGPSILLLCDDGCEAGVWAVGDDSVLG